MLLLQNSYTSNSTPPKEFNSFYYVQTFKSMVIIFKKPKIKPLSQHKTQILITIKNDVITVFFIKNGYNVVVSNFTIIFLFVTAG